MSRPIDRQPEVKPQVQRDMQPQTQKPLPGKGLYESIKPAGVGIKDIVNDRNHATQKPASGGNRVAEKGWKDHIQATIRGEKKSASIDIKEAKAGDSAMKWAIIKDEAATKAMNNRMAAMREKLRGKLTGQMLQKDKQMFNGMKSSIARSLPKFLVKVLELRRCLSKKLSVNEREIEKTFEALRDKSLSPEEQKKIKDRRVKLIEDNEKLIQAKRQIAELPDDLQIDLLEDGDLLEKVS